MPSIERETVTMANGDEDNNKETDSTQEGAWAAAGFAVVLVIVGLPVWWYTTTVYRAHLPYATIEELSQQMRYHGVGVTLIGATNPTFSTDLDKQLKSLRKLQLKYYFVKERNDKLCHSFCKLFHRHFFFFFFCCRGVQVL